MKKKIFCLIMLLIIPTSLLLSGCSGKNNSSNGQNPEEQVEFITLKDYTRLTYINLKAVIVVNKATRVMYMVDNNGAITVMLNADGSPMIYQGEL